MNWLWCVRNGTQWGICVWARTLRIKFEWIVSRCFFALRPFQRTGYRKSPSGRISIVFFGSIYQLIDKYKSHKISMIAVHHSIYPFLSLIDTYFAYKLCTELLKKLITSCMSTRRESIKKRHLMAASTNITTTLHTCPYIGLFVCSRDAHAYNNNLHWCRGNSVIDSKIWTKSHI